MSLFYTFIRPVFYLFIKDPSGDKKWVDWLFPCFITSILVMFFIKEDMPRIVGNDGILSKLAGFLQIMPGFYLTALAAVSTFTNSNLDLLLPEPYPTISIMYNGYKIKNMALTRRRFLNYLFSYLTILSLLLYFTIIITELFVDTNFTKYIFFQRWIKPILIWSYTLFLFQMLSITIFSLYQLCERIHQVENK